MTELKDGKIIKTKISLEEILNKTQKYISQNFSSSLLKIKDKDNNNEVLLSYIKKYIEDNKYVVDDYTKDELINYIFREMKTVSFLEKYLNDKEVEEINILSYRDIEIRYNNGQNIRTKEEFLSPENEVNVLTRLLSESKIIFNTTNPIAIGHMDQNKRITIFSDPIFDAKKGVGASIRIVNPKKLTTKDFIDSGEMTEEMANVLSLLYRYGVSICLSGETGSGKTTLIEFFLGTVEDDKRIVTIEEDTRELSGDKYDENGRMINNIIHLVTKKSETEKQAVNMSDLLKLALTIDPDCLVMAEMKGDEAIETVAAANTGHVVLTTTHADSCRSTYYRILELCKKNSNISDNILLHMIARAFPIVIKVNKLKDHTRRIVEITECTDIVNNEPVIKTLFIFDITETVLKEDGTKKVIGKFKKLNSPSENIRRKFIENGATKEELEKVFGGSKC